MRVASDQNVHNHGSFRVMFFGEALIPASTYNRRHTSKSRAIREDAQIVVARRDFSR
jgi:hypothetical protein